MNPESLHSTRSGPVWRLSGGDGTRGGLFPRPVELKGKRARRLAARGRVRAAVVFDDAGRGFVADLSGAVQAFSPEGKLLWRVQLDGGVSATPAVHPQLARLYVGTQHGCVYALGTVDGAAIWQTTLPTAADPRVLSDLLWIPDPDSVVLSSWGGRWVMLDGGSGAERAAWDAGISPAAAAAAEFSGALYLQRAVAGRGVELVRVQPGTAEVILHRDPEDARGARRALVTAAPVLDDARAVGFAVFNRTGGARLLSWDLRSGKVLWERPMEGQVQATPALQSDGGIVVADLSGTVRSLGPDGSMRYRFVTGCEYLLAGGVCTGEGVCFLGDPWGRVHRIDASGAGRIVFEGSRGIEARLAFDARGRLFAPSTDPVVDVLESRAAA